MTELKQKYLRIKAHNKIIKALRELGELPVLGTLTKPKKVKKRIAHLSENGSLLPNKFACWDYPFNTITSKDI